MGLAGGDTAGCLPCPPRLCSCCPFPACWVPVIDGRRRWQGQVTDDGLWGVCSKGKEYLDEGGLLLRRLEKLGWCELQGDGCGCAYGHLSGAESLEGGL